MNYTLENFISYCEEMEIADESLRESKDIYDTTLDKIETLLDRARKAKKPENKIAILNDLIKLVDETVKHLKGLTDDNIDKALSVGSKLVSIMLKIQISKNIVASMATSIWTGAAMSLPTFAFYYIGNSLAKNILKTMTIREKKKVRDNCVKELLEYKKYANTMINITKTEMKKADKPIPSTESTMVAIAEESVTDVVRVVKEKFNGLIEKIRRWLQALKSWIDTKLYKLLKIQYILIDVKYYNEVMSFINGIRNLGKDPKTYIQVLRANYTALTSTDEDKIAAAIDKMKDIYENVSDSLSLLNEKRKEIPTPKEGGKVISVALEDLAALKSYFQTYLALGQVMIKEIMDGMKKMDNVKMIENDQTKKDCVAEVEKLNRLFMSNAFAISNLCITKSQICIHLVNEIIRNGKSPESEKKEEKKEDDK